MLLDFLMKLIKCRNILKGIIMLSVKIKFENSKQI